MNKETIIFIGAIPPPYHGVTISNKRILGSKLSNFFEVYHLDTSDHRKGSLGKFEVNPIN
jgi:hypothetical protein